MCFTSKGKVTEIINRKIKYDPILGVWIYLFLKIFCTIIFLIILFKCSYISNIYLLNLAQLVTKITLLNTVITRVRMFITLKTLTNACKYALKKENITLKNNIVDYKYTLINIFFYLLKNTNTCIKIMTLKIYCGYLKYSVKE